MSEISKSLIVSFDALNLVKGIKSIGGPDKQVFYIESNLFAPDRRITPLILQPYILVEDPHNIIPSGDKVSELSSAEWYFDEIKSENRITAKEENASIDTPFALGANNSLHIRKNVEKAIQLFFEAEYLDTRKDKNIHISLTYLLSTTQSSEVKPAPKLKLSKPQSWKYCPLDKATEATIEAEVFADNKGYKSAVEWCKVEGDKVTPLTNEPFVLGGQNTDKLKINPHVMGDSLIRVRNVSEEFYNKVYGINKVTEGVALEELNFRNLLVNGDFNKGLSGWLGYLSNRKIVSNGIEVSNEESNRIAQVWKDKKIFKSDDIMYSCIRISDCTKVNKIQLKYGVSAETSENLIDSKDNPPVNFILSGLYKVTESTIRQLMVQYYPKDYTKIVINNCIIINLTQTFGKGNEPTKEQLDAVFADMPYIPAPEDLAPDGIIKGDYESDIKFTKYFPEINAEILFLTGDSIRPEHKTINAQAIFTTNKEPIKNPSEFFNIEWYLDPVEAGGVPKQIGTGEFMEIPVSDLQLKGGRLVPIRLKYNFK